ncbi:hypothetical protein BSKO_11418 [Bryopsis sp. KO-2023]|nr:hypothetical protein BSKO_11418 [Bryopsis sp. KO-2023]
MRVLSRLKSVDFYKKLPSDLSEATLTGAWISILAAVMIASLLGLELFDFMSVKTHTEMVVDRSRQGELLRINFNISFPALSCEFASLDVSDALGTKRLNLTKTVRKTPIDPNMIVMGRSGEDKEIPEPKYDDDVSNFNDVDVTQPLKAATFDMTVRHYPIVIVNFYAPWCPWCQRLEPAWEAATKEIHDKYPESDRRIRLAKVDCTIEQALCRVHAVAGFPSIRIYRSGHDDIYVQGMHEHEAYVGDRTKGALVSFAESLVPSAGNPHAHHPQTEKRAKSSGCNMAGFVLVKKVPGTLHFLAKSNGHSFDHAWMNMTHAVHHFYFGTRPSPYRYKFLKKMHPLGLSKDWADKLTGDQFISHNPQSTHEHFTQVVLTSVEAGAGHALNYDAYEYTVHSHTYSSDSIPAAKFTYQLSPIQLVVRETPRELYKFVTSLCAIVGGVFTVAGIFDSIVYQGVKFAKKIELGKQN